MIVLDTNVLSELMRAKPAPEVLAWASLQAPDSLFTTTINQAEILAGVAMMPRGRRQVQLAELAEDIFGIFEDRILSFDSEAAHEYASLRALRRSIGEPMSTEDAQIAAIARSKGATLATRNTSDFHGCDLMVVDPWLKRTSGPEHVTALRTHE